MKTKECRFSHFAKLDESEFSSSKNCSTMLKNNRISSIIISKLPEEIEKIQHFHKNGIFEKSFEHTFLFHSIFIWHESKQSKVLKGVVVDLKKV